MPVNMVQVSFLLGTHLSWAALLLKYSNDKLKYPSVETRGVWKPLTFEIDIFGQIHPKPVSDTQSQNHTESENTSAYPLQGAARSTMLPASSQENICCQMERETLSTSATGPKSGGNDDPEISQVDFSSCQRLDWTDNTKDWQKYVNRKGFKTDDITGSCSMWKPTLPMNITPDKESIR